MDKKRFSLARVLLLYRIYSGTVRSRIKNFLKSLFPIPKTYEKNYYGLVAYWNLWGVIGLMPFEWFTLNRLLRSAVSREQWGAALSELLYVLSGRLLL